MPSSFESILLPSFISGIVFIIASVITLTYPPKKINWYYGYRTDLSMKNQNSWDFAQKYSSVQLIIAGCVIMIFSCIGLVIQFSKMARISISLILIFSAILFMWLKTERALKAKFN